MRTLSQFRMNGQEEDFQKTRGGIPKGLIETSLTCRELDKANIPHVKGKIGWLDKRKPDIRNFVSARSNKGKLAKAMEIMTKDEKKAVYEKAKQEKLYWVRNHEHAKRLAKKRREEQERKELAEAIVVEINEEGFLQDPCYVLRHQEWDWIETEHLDVQGRYRLDAYKHKETGRIVEVKKFDMYGDGYGVDSGSIAFFPNSLQFSPSATEPAFFEGFINKVQLVGHKYIRVISNSLVLDISTNY